MEENFKGSVGSLILSGLLFFIQLYFRSVLSEIKKSITDTKIEIGKIYDRLNSMDQKVTAAGIEIENSKEDIKEIKIDCKGRHRT